MSEQEIKRLKWRINQQRRRERLYRERGSIPLAQTADAVYMRAYRRGVRHVYSQTPKAISMRAYHRGIRKRARS